MNKSILLALLASLLLCLSFNANGQKIALKNNLVYDAAYLTPNLALEVGLGKKTTLELGGGYNPFKFGSDGHFKHYLIQPEFRYWLCERFNGTFFGLHMHGGEYNIAGIDLPFDIFPNLKTNRYEGYFYGVGLSVGHQWILSPHWGVEATIGAGYTHVYFDKYCFVDCSPRRDYGKRDYFSVTKAGISFIYFFK